ncbi:MAG: hydroxymethylbilane synthase [Xanthomonadales bacterium]|nr:hydroxymethylbilane synthase [Xanthomonadales bacterium]
MDRIRIATRKSALALWQARFVAEELKAKHPGLAVILVPMSTRGDQILDQPLARIGGKGLFLKELEQAMLEDRADIAVHSMKDVPAEMPPEFALGAILDRHDPRDALVSPDVHTVDDLSTAARVGTSSLRRQAQLLNWRPDLEVVSLRGNVNTRLEKLDRGDYDAILLAAAGLDRLEMSGRIGQRIPVERCLPAVAQGAIGIETRAGDNQVLELVGAVHDDSTGLCVSAERAFSATLGGSCQVPVAGHAQLKGRRIELAGLVASPDGQQLLRDTVEGMASDAESLGTQLGQRLLDAGARDILAAL